MTINLADNNPRANYTATSGQTAFSIPFDYFDDGDVSVYVNGTLKTITTDYTLTTTTVTFTAGLTAGDKVAITRDVPLERTTDLTSTYNAASINSQLDTIVAQIADLDDRVSRSISLNDYEVGVSLDLPATADRLGKTIQFNSSTGALEVGPSGDELTSLAGITSDITTVAGVASDLSTVATAASNINAVGLNISKVSTVSNNISTILSVNSNISDIRSVADSITNLNDVADSIDQVELVAGSISNVDTVALANSNISTVAGDINNINTVAGISTNITTVAGITNAISTVNANAADITSVSNNIDDVNDVANVITKVTTVADNISNVNTLSGQASNIGTLAGISGSINSLGGISSDITTLAAVASDIGDAATNAASALSAKNAAEAARDATLAAYDSFDDRYLGAKSEEPTLDNDNNPLVAGSLYFDNNSNSMKLYTGSAWVAAYIAGNDYLALSGGTLTGQVNTTANITFGDNDKAIFGAGSDLQIYHDGAASYIVDNGTGNLRMQGVVQVADSPDSNDGRIIFGDGTTAQGLVHYDYSAGDFLFENTWANAAADFVFRTNSVNALTVSPTGIDVTGTITADDHVYIEGNAARLSFGENDTTDLNTRLSLQTSSFRVETVNNSFASAINRITVDNSTGDISFYEDTGTTAKLHWSAADESLGIGLSSASHVLDVTGDKDTWITKLYNSGSDANASGLLVRSDATAAHDASVLGVYADGGYKMMVKSSGNVGIGTSSPSAPLQVKGSAGEIRLQRPTASQSDWSFKLPSSGGELTFYDNNNAAERMRIDSSGNVGIGTSSPSYLVDAQTSSGNAQMQIKSGSDLAQLILTSTDTTGSSQINFADADSNNVGMLQYFHSDNHMEFTVNSAEAMRIDSSGNLLVGTTNVAPAGNNVEGVAIGAGGYIQASYDGFAPMSLNRKTNDGDIALFKKDGTTVGSIGNSGTALLFENPNANSYLAFHANNQSNGIFYQDGTTKNFAPYTARTGEFDLGNSGGRWKDLYLSGGVYLGGTGAANKLDDYEEGTWTPTISSGTISAADARYVKIGSQVTVSAIINDISDNTTSADIVIGGFPYTSSSSNRSVGSVMFRYFTKTNAAQMTTYLGGNTTQMALYWSFETNANWQPVEYQDGAQANMDIIFTFTYRV